MWAVQQILFMSVDKRLAIFLKEEAEKNNSLELKITHEQIAKYMATGAVGAGTANSSTSFTVTYQ